jgi:hypothetical protein
MAQNRRTAHPAGAKWVLGTARDPSIARALSEEQAWREKSSLPPRRLEHRMKRLVLVVDGVGGPARRIWMAPHDVQPEGALAHSVVIIRMLSAIACLSNTFFQSLTKISSFARSTALLAASDIRTPGSLSNRIASSMLI